MHATPLRVRSGLAGRCHAGGFPSHTSACALRTSRSATRRPSGRRLHFIFHIGSAGPCPTIQPFSASARTGLAPSRLHKAGAGWITYTGGTAQPLDGSIITTTASGYKIEFDDGSTTLFEQTTTDSTGQTCYFATLQADPEGNALSFSYSTTTPSCIQNTIFTNQSFTGHISMDAASRIAF